MAALCKSCSLKHSYVVPPGNQINLVSDSQSIHFPMFVFAVQKTIYAFRLKPVKSAQPPLADSYEDALPDGLLRPPGHNLQKPKPTCLNRRGAKYAKF